MARLECRTQSCSRVATSALSAFMFAMEEAGQNARSTLLRHARTGETHRESVSKTVSRVVRWESGGSKNGVGLVYTGVTGMRDIRKCLQINKGPVRFRPSPPSPVSSGIRKICPGTKGRYPPHPTEFYTRTENRMLRHPSVSSGILRLCFPKSPRATVGHARKREESISLNPVSQLWRDVLPP
jgi:hypothetical protein